MQTHIQSNQIGFTLLELMVVVGLIGTLAAIAVPQYSSFVSKARQSEAKINLSAAYTALKGFAAENGSYTVCLRQAGYAPDATSTSGATRYYLIGFQVENYFTTLCGPGGDQACGYYSFAGQPSGMGCVWGSPPPCCLEGHSSVDEDYQYPANATVSVPTAWPSDGNLIDLNAMVSANQFRIGAAGGISTTNSPACLRGINWYHNLDGWTIDDTKTLINARPCI